MIVREYRLFDTQAIMKLFYDTVHDINIQDYTIEQVNAWAQSDMNYEVWHKRSQAKLPYIAEINGEIVGFGELEADGHINCFYCHSKYQRMGIGSKLLSLMENIASLRGVKRLYTEASITAKPFFLFKGFSIVREQQVQLRGVLFQNYVMEKYF